MSETHTNTSPTQLASTLFDANSDGNLRHRPAPRKTREFFERHFFAGPIKRVVSYQSEPESREHPDLARFVVELLYTRPDEVETSD
jgi:hypothetical protein